MEGTIKNWPIGPWASNYRCTLEPTVKQPGIALPYGSPQHCPSLHPKPPLTSGAMNAIVPSNCPWNSPAPVPFDANLAAAPKSAILSLWPVLSMSRLAPVNRDGRWPRRLDQIRTSGAPRSSAVNYDNVGTATTSQRVAPAFLCTLCKGTLVSLVCV